MDPGLHLIWNLTPISPKVEFHKAKHEAAELKTKAETAAPFTPKLSELFATLPNTLEQLDEAIEDARARADVSYSTNPKVIEEYEARCKEVKSPFLTELPNIRANGNL